MKRSCLLLSWRPDRSQIGRLLRGQGLDVYEMEECSRAEDVVRARNWTVVIIESVLPEQDGRYFIKRLRGLRIFPPKFFLLCNSYDEVRQISPIDYEIMGVPPRPLDNYGKLSAILHTYRIV